MRVPLLIGNWKLHGTNHSVNGLLDQLILGISTHADNTIAKAVVLPPAIFIPQVAEHLYSSPIAWGGQNMAEHEKGAYTGEVSGAMLREFGCRYVLLGHSERRQYFQETDTQIARKLALAQKEDLIPIVCLGETWQQYQSGQTQTVLLQQLKGHLAVVKTTLQQVVFAYEPIWAVGTGHGPTPRAAQIIHESLRAEIANHLGKELANQIRILYGGSVKPDNAEALFAMPDIDGGLIGNASLSADSFLKIYRAFR